MTEEASVIHISKDETPKQPIFRKSVETGQIYERLKASSVGDTIGYLELSELIGKNVQFKGRGHLVSAIRMLEKEKIVFAAVKNIGVKNCNSIEKVEYGSSGVDWIRRKARRSARKIMCAEYGELSKDAQSKYNSYLAAFGAISLFSKKSTVSKIEHYSPTVRIDLKKTLELFSK